MVNVNIKNIDRLIQRFENVKTADLTPLVTKATLIVEAQAKSLCPVNDGGLRMSIHAKVETKGVNIIGMVYTSKEYAMYVEFGTGIKGNGTYPYDVEGLTLEYKDTGWVYTPDGGDTFYYTEGMEAQPYMYPALHQNKDKIKKLINDGYTELLRKSIGGG